MKVIALLVATLFCLTLFLCFLSFAQTQDETNALFYSANKVYEEGKYQDAVKEYQKILEQGYQSEALYYNLGNCYFKLGSLGKTILYYEKALKLSPNDPELKTNYNYVRSQLLDKIAPSKRNWFQKKYFDLVKSITLGKWLSCTIVLWLLIVILIFVKIFAPGYRGIYKYSFITLFLLFVLVASCAISQYNITGINKAIVLAQEVPVRYGPGEAEVEAFLLNEGAKVTIKKEVNDWYQIKLPDGKSGWLPKASVEII